MPSVKNVKLKIRGVKEWLDAIDFRDNRLWSMVGNKLVTCVNGEWMDQKEFDEKYPFQLKYLSTIQQKTLIKQGFIFYENNNHQNKRTQTG